MLMLAIVAFWAASPALACLTPVPCHGCCRAMMTDCPSATVSAVDPCCQLQMPASAVPQDRAVAPEPKIGAMQSIAPAVPPDLDLPAGRIAVFSKTPAPRCQLGASTVLRI